MVFQNCTLARPYPSIEKHLIRKSKSLLPTTLRRNCFQTMYITLQKSLKPSFPNGRLVSYGSYPAGVSLNDSDLDLTMFLDINEEEKKEVDTCHDIKRILRKLPDVKNPRVAYIKDKHRTVGTFKRYYIDYSLSLNNFDGPLVSSIFNTADSNHKLARNLILLLKEFARVQGLTSLKNGYPSSTSYCYLAIVVLQLAKVLRRFHKTDLAHLRDLVHDPNNTTLPYINVEVPESSPSLPILSDLLYRVFRFFIYEVDLSVYALSVTRSHFRKKSDLGWPHTNSIGIVIQKNLVCIENPFRNENLSCSINKSGLAHVNFAFEKACSLLRSGSPVKQLFQRFPYQQNKDSGK